MKRLVTFSRSGSIGVLRIDNPPLNTITAAVTDDLAAALVAFERDRAAQALVVCCAGHTFVTGCDLASVDKPDFSVQPFNRLLARIDEMDRPVIAAMHGTVLGSGWELALACHYRIARRETQFGFPEVKLGLLPASLGTQRLPRAVGIVLALDLIGSGRRMGADEALRAGVLDATFDGDAAEGGVNFAIQILERSDPIPRLREQRVSTDGLPTDFFAKQRERSRLQQATHPAAAAVVQAVEASTLPLAQGAEVEARCFEALRASPQSKALRHLDCAQRQAAQVPGISRDALGRAISQVGVLGAGTMGRGIAMNFLNVGIPVVLVDTAPPALAAAQAAVRSLYEANVVKRRITPAELADRMGLLTLSDRDAALADCDLVIEAVYENLDLKRRVCARLGQVCKPGAIIATNTSTLDVDALAQATGRPADVVGMHFFSPAHVMRLLELVRGAGTAPEVLATAMRLARTIGKVPVVSGVCYGFIGNRMAEVYMREAEFLIMQGASPFEVDAAVEAFGMAMGPCRMLDMAGIDVGAKTVIEYGKTGGLPPDPSYRALVQELFALGRHGQKAGAGYYRYEGRTPVPDEETVHIAERLALVHGIARRSAISQVEIFERLLYPMINEAAKILEEGIAYRPGDIDVVWTAGYGFPDHRGGPLFTADHIGLPQIVDGLSRYGAQCGDRFGYWTASPLLADLAATSRRISDWRPMS